MVVLAVALQVLGVVSAAAALWLLAGPAASLLLLGAVTTAAGLELEKREP